LKKDNTAYNYLSSLISKGENQWLDFKFEISDSRKIARTISAFANTDGGRLLVGVKDNGKIAGIRSDEELYMVEGAAKLHLKPSISPEFKIWGVENKQVIEVIISKSNKIPHYAPSENGKMRAYIRIKDENVIAENVVLKIWEKTKKRAVFLKYSDAEKTILDYLKTNNYASINDIMKIAILNIDEAEDLISDLVSVGALSYLIVNYKTQFYLNKSFTKLKYNH